MSTILNPIENLPDISYIDNITLDETLAEMIRDYQLKYEELTGVSISLAQADPYRLILNACATQIYQGFQFIDRAGKQNLLKYSYSEFLDNIAAMKGITRNAAQPAKVIVKFTLSGVRASATPIPVGTRVVAGELYFESIEYVEIKAAETEVNVEMTCTTEGEIGNNLLVGEITTLADPIAYITSVINTTVSSGGSEIESDESLAERTFLAPSGYSTAGPDEAYIYWAKTFSNKVADVEVSSQRPCEVDVRFIMDNGELPDSQMIQGLQEFLSDKKIRPLTDKVTVSAPDSNEYVINVSYYINKSDIGKAAIIQDQVNSAIANYITWQSSKIGRDINPSELIGKMMAAGAKRVEVVSPIYTAIAETSVAKLTSQSITYGGIEND